MGAVKPLTHKNSFFHRTKFLTAILLPLFILFILATITYASFTDEWGEYQDHYTTRGFVHDETAHYTSELGITYTTANGYAFQPLAANLTGNGDLEIIIYSGNFLQLYDEQLNLVDEKDMGNPPLAQPTLHDNGTVKTIISLIDRQIEAWYYNGTAFVDNFANDTTLNTTCTEYDGIRCKNDQCYILCSNTTSTFVYKFNLTLDNWLESEFASVDKVRGVMAIEDIDLDGIDELVFICDADGNNQDGICVAEVNTTGNPPNLDTGFSGDGIIDDLTSSTLHRIGNPLIHNINGAGHHEIVINYYGIGMKIGVYRSDGSNYGSFPYAYSDAVVTTTASTPTIAAMGGTREYICGHATNVGTKYNVECVDENTVLQMKIANTTAADSFNRISMIAADLNSNGIDELLTPRAVYTVDNETLVTVSLENTNLVLADVNNDGELDIISTKAGTTKIVYSNFTNNPPTLNNTQNYGGYGGTLDYTTPICVGSTLTFLAQECGGLGTCNYDNDGSSDTERIVSNCGQLASGAASTSFTNNLANGTFAGASPSFQCVYNVTGIFSVRLFLQDNFNDADFTQYNTQTITVQVINGTAGITCNLGSAVSPGDTGGIVPSAQESQTNEAIDDTLGILFGSGSGSDKLKLIVGIALILGIIAAAYREGVKDGTGVLVVAGLATLLVTFIGLITPAIFILGLALVLFVLFLGRSLVGGGAPNGGP